MHPVEKNPKIIPGQLESRAVPKIQKSGQVVKLPNQLNMKQKKPPVFSGSGSNLVIGKPKGWLPFGFTRLLRAKRQLDYTEPTPQDFNVVEGMKTDELLMRLARISLAVQNSDMKKTQVGMRGLKRLDTHIGGIYKLATRIQFTKQ